MVDANQKWSVPEAIEWMKELAQFKLHWIEEPTSPDDILGHLGQIFLLKLADQNESVNQGETIITTIIKIKEIHKMKTTAQTAESVDPELADSMTDSVESVRTQNCPDFVTLLSFAKISHNSDY